MGGGLAYRLVFCRGWYGLLKNGQVFGTFVTLGEVFGIVSLIEVLPRVLSIENLL